MAKANLLEKIINKGGENGDQSIADPVAKKATLPNSKDQGEKTNPVHTAAELDQKTPSMGGNASAASNKATLNMKSSDASAANVTARLKLKEESANEDNVTAKVAGHSVTLHRHLSEPGTSDTYTLHHPSGKKTAKISFDKHGNGDEVHGEKVNKAFGLEGNHKLGHKIAGSMNGEGGISKFQESYDPDMDSVSIDVAFEGEDLSEEFKEKATTIFEAAVNAKVQSITEELQTEFQERLEESVGEFTSKLAEQIDEYLTYVAEQWMEENEVAIEHSLRSEITEEFIDGMRKLFSENYIEIPEDKFNVIDELAAKVEELEVKLNESVNDNIELASTLKDYVKEAIFANVSEGLTVTQKEKFATLADGVEFTNEEGYTKKLDTIKESYFKTKVGSDIVEGEINEAVEDNSKTETRVSGPVANYVQAISRSVKK